MSSNGLISAFESETFGQDASFRLEQPVGSMSISPCGRDVVLASKDGLYIIDLDSPYSPPRHLPHHTSWEVADVQWSPFSSRDYWVVSTSNQKALVWNLAVKDRQDAIDFTLHGHTRAITDINFSAHNPDVLATCAVDSFVHCWDLRVHNLRPVVSFSDWFAGATQVKWSRQDSHVVASSHDRFLHIWDDRNGALPVRSIEAHDTKIYGIDWNRFHTEKIVTCSLDKTIKFWDCNNPEDVPERIIETPFPVWRARHTPFGWGLLVMPQRGSNDLHLYDRRGANNEPPPSGRVPPAFRFEGHKGQVKEFLWRPRGNINNDVDHRDFQLVSWGTDRELRLHKLEPSTLHAVGYEKGATHIRLNFTRKGAKYKTFRDEPVAEETLISTNVHRESLSTKSQSLRIRPRGSTSVGMSKVSIPQFRGWAQSGGSRFRTGMHGKVSTRQDMSPIAWMKNVRIATWHQETLAEEITQIGEKFPKVEFEEIEIQQRRLTISLHGPWGEENGSVYLRIDMKFPKLYPREASARVTVQHTASLTDDVLRLLSTEIQTISETYASRRKGCIEAVLRYLLRDQNLEQALSFALDESLVDQQLLSGVDLPGEVSSDDDDDDDQIQAPVDLLNTSNANVRVPLAKACGALWSDSGKLVCFFPPKVNQHSSIIMALDPKDPDHSRPFRMFEGFGRLHTGSLSPKTTIGAKTDDDGSSDTSETSESTSSGSSSSTDDAKGMFSGFLPNKAWHRNVTLRRRSRSADRSNRSTNGFTPSMDPRRTNIVSIHVFDDLVPSKPDVAANYRIFGNGPDVCEHNSLVAQQASDEVGAAVWHLAKLILQNNVPLESLYDGTSSQSIITVAQAAKLAYCRRDSGVDLSHDFRQAASKPSVSGRIRWGNSPLGPGYLIPALFRHFEILGDVQMLAMLSCVFSEPRALNPEALLAPHKDQDLSIELKAPAFGVDYFPSEQVAKSIISPDPDFSLMVVDRMSSTILAPSGFGSSPSEAPQSSSDPANKTLISTGNTPPSVGDLSFQKQRRLSRTSSIVPRESAVGELSTTNPAMASLSTSPEETRLSNRSNSTIPFSISRASLSALQSAYSGSPPVSINGLSNNGKSPSPSGGGWSPAGIFGQASAGRGSRTHQASTASSDEYRSGHLLSSSSFSNLRNPKRVGSETPQASQRESKTELSTVTSSGNKTVKANDRRRARLKVRLHNQKTFDNDGYASVPLLDPNLEWKYKSYRASYAHFLGVWELYPQMAEILKFDGLVGYFTPDTGTQQELSLGHARQKTMTEDSVRAAVAKRGLELRRCCRVCGKLLAAIEKNGAPIGWHCTTSGCCSNSKTSIRQFCAICNKVVDGLMVPCLQCGHTSCYECAQGWFGLQEPPKFGTRPYGTGEEQEEGDAVNENERSCPSGCGCVCSILDTIDVPFPQEPDAENALGRPPTNRQDTDVALQSERLMSQQGPDTTTGAILSLRRSRSISAAKENILRGRSIDGLVTVESDPFMPNADDELDPWSNSNFAGLGRGFGGGLSRGLSTKSSDATIRKSMDK